MVTGLPACRASISSFPQRRCGRYRCCWRTPANCPTRRRQVSKNRKNLGHKGSRSSLITAEKENRDERFFEENGPRRTRIDLDLFVASGRQGTDSNLTNCERCEYFPFDARSEAAAKRAVRL